MKSIKPKAPSSLLNNSPLLALTWVVKSSAKALPETVLKFGENSLSNAPDRLSVVFNFPSRSLAIGARFCSSSKSLNDFAISNPSAAKFKLKVGVSFFVEMSPEIDKAPSKIFDYIFWSATCWSFMYKVPVTSFKFKLS